MSNIQYILSNIVFLYFKRYFSFCFCSRIADNLHEFLPNLESLILTGNNLQEFSDLDPLISLPKLETLSLLSNPIITQPHFREYIAFKLAIWLFLHRNLLINFIYIPRFPRLRLLDFRKIRQKDRKAASEFFKTKAGKELLREIAKKGKTAISTSAGNDANTAKGLWKMNCVDEYFIIIETVSVPTASPADIQKIREAIKNATSLQEVERLTRILQSGNIPEEFLNSNGNSENGLFGTRIIDTTNIFWSFHFHFRHKWSWNGYVIGKCFPICSNQ